MHKYGAHIFHTSNKQVWDYVNRFAERETDIIFGGRLGEYKYYDMDKVILSALEKIRTL